MAIELFPDQQDALARVLALYHQAPLGGRALVVAPTAWGKTIFFSSLIHTLKSDKPVLIIAHRDELLDQAREKMSMVDPTAFVGKVGGGVHEYGAPITVAGIDTISGERHLKNLHTFGYGLMIVDEGHHACAPKYQKVFQALPDVFRLGVTATPERLDGQSLEPIFGPPIFTMTIVEAIAKKRLSDVRAVAIRTEVSLDNLQTKRNADGAIDFSQQELDLAVNTPTRNRRVVEAYQEHAHGKRAICFAVTISHAEALARVFNDHGISAAVVKGDTPLPERKKLYTAFDRGEIKVLTNVLVLTEGFDQPKVECVIMARPTQSRSLYVQMAGRGLRLAPGKKCCLLLDITDNCLKHRLMPQDLCRTLRKQLRENETVTEALAREKQETTEKVAVTHKLPEKRLLDLHINLFETLEWQERPGGIYALEVGMEKHRIALVPSRQTEGYYYVAARLAPQFGAQRWSLDQPLDWCQQIAEKRARILLSEPQKLVFLDKRAPWREQPIDPDGKQVKMLNWYNIPWIPTMTKGEASDLIDAHQIAIERKKAARLARKAQEEQVSI